MKKIKLTDRQEEIIRLVKENQPITSEKIAGKLNVTRAALRPDLAILTMTGILEARPKVGYIYSKKPSYSIIYDHLKGVKSKEIMSNVSLVQEECSVYDGIVQLFLNDVGTLFIENEEEGLVGAVSRKDFLKIAMGGTDMHKVPIGIIMTRMPNIIFISEEDCVYDAAKKIITHEVDSLPVVRVSKKDGKDFNKVVGKVSKTNITRFLINLSENG
ncbi:helix-turn-helix transcriptional regulator [Hathewaya histolytica]|uniref:CBS domain-containing protein n=1 Tax=Hathewaya histolytica TaxID=1498 RepID=A0A4U9RFC5_HATHI|nr:helix-turn-helix transcriptional regulator [Hathewaya histolytica]VTQ90565.1 CBS domain-containing protein [Hathewaya histolytica]